MTAREQRNSLLTNPGVRVGRGMLLDRLDERGIIDRVLADVRAAESRALVLLGDAGIGKSTLLGYALEQAAGYRVVRGAGVEAEHELAFAALHQICAPMLDGLPSLPAPQRVALRTAFGLDDGDPPDGFMVGLAVLGLLAEHAREQPVLCLVDDAQWMDRASALALGFAARRLRAESVAMIFAVRECEPRAAMPELAGLAELRLVGLPDEDARALLTLAFPGPVDEQVLERVIAESHGNPLALLELPRGFTPAELAGGFGIGRAVTLPRRIEQSFGRQIDALSATTRLVLLVAAAEPVGDPELVWRAVDRLGLSIPDARTTEAAGDGLVQFGPSIRFRHPLLRSVIYNAASPEQRRHVHRALAEATSAVTDPDRRTWHLAQASEAPDESVAAELEACAGRARSRGGFAAAGAFLERASELSPDPADRGRRALAAARAKLAAGMPDAATRLLSLAGSGLLDDLGRARADLLRARIAFTVNRDRQTPALLLKAAAQLKPLDARLARETYLEAFRAAWFATGPSGGVTTRDVALAAASAPAPTTTPRPVDLLLDGLIVRYTEGYAAAAPVLRRALEAFDGAELAGEEALRWLWFASATALDLCDDAAADTLTGRFVQLSRETGALAALPMALSTRIALDVLAGDLAAAGMLMEELEAITDGTGIRTVPYTGQLFAAWKGRKGPALALISASAAEAERRGEGLGAINTALSRAVLFNGLGLFDEALVAAQQATAPGQELGVLTWASLIELVTAASHSGRRDVACDAVRRLEVVTQASRTQWAAGLESLCRAMVSDDASAEKTYLEAVERLACARSRGQLARAHLYYGEWLRRKNRRSDARDQLRTSHDMFDAMGMEAFTETAARELAACGESVRKRGTGSLDQLTAQEEHIARLVAQGHSNAEIATRLFISPRTVEWHLSKIFTKLGITSRRQLRR